MVQYYNLTKLADSEGYISLYSKFTEIAPAFPLFLIIMCWTVSFGYLVNKSKREGEILDTNDSIHYSTLFTLIITIIFYVGNIIQDSQYIYILSIIYLFTAVNRFYNNS